MARAPVPGRCKTRLIPVLGRRGAARLHEQLTGAAIRKAQSVAPAVLAVHPHARHRFFTTWRRRGVPVQRQAGRDLGQRMRRAINIALRTYKTVVVIGTDCPSLTPSDLRQLAQCSATGAVACLAAADGGYVALAVSTDHPALFRRIDWGSARVLRQTRGAARRSGATFEELGKRMDLDTPADYFWHRRRGRLPRPF